MIHAFTLRRHLDLMAQRGFGAAAVLEGTGISPERVQDRTYEISLEQRRAVTANMLGLTGNPALGLEFGKVTRISQFGPLGHLLLSSHSIWQQYESWLRYGEPLLGVPVAVKVLRNTDGSWSAFYQDPIPKGPEHIFNMEELISISNKLVMTLTGEPLRLKGICFDYPRPAHAHLYAEVFGCPVEFGCNRVEMMATAPFPEQFFPGADDQIGETCATFCGQLLEEIAGDRLVSTRLRSAFAAKLGTTLSIEDAAAALGMSSRTLRRRLADEGSSFHKVYNDYRRDTAISYVLGRRLKPKEIAYRLGFKFDSDFRRAFKTWTGSSISDFLVASDADSSQPTVFRSPI